MKNEITQEMEKALLKAHEREREFWKRHNVSDEDDTRLTGFATPAHRAWVSAVEREYKLMSKESRVHLDMPISRKAFILGFRMARAQVEKKDG